MASYQPGGGLQGLPSDADIRPGGIAAFLFGQREGGAVDPSRLSRALLPHLFILVRETQDDVAPRLKIRLTGTAIDTTFGRHVAGRYMEEFMHGPHSAEVLHSFHRCVLQRQVVWMRQVVNFPGRFPRYIEAVAMPLGPDRIYGGLVEGPAAKTDGHGRFEQAWLDESGFGALAAAD